MTPRRGAELTLLVIATGVVFDGLVVEPYRLEVTEHRVAAPARLRIAHLSDLHTHGFGRLERDVVARLDALRPDVIVVTGGIGTSVLPVRFLCAPELAIFDLAPP